MRHTRATALIDHLHERDLTDIHASLPAALNSQLIPASRLAPHAQKNIDDELTHILENGLVTGVLHELRCSQTRDIGALTGFMFALLARMKKWQQNPVLWISAPFADTSNMTLFPDGLSHLGFEAERLVLVSPLSVKHALWAADEAAKCTDLAAVILHVQGHPKALDMTATRRLSLRASESDTSVFILRQSGEEEASAATTRWRISPNISHWNEMPAENCQPNSPMAETIGHTAFSTHLERNRQGATGRISLTWNHQIRGFSHVRTDPSDNNQMSATVPQHRLSGTVDRSGQPPALGQVVALQQPLERTG